MNDTALQALLVAIVILPAVGALATVLSPARSEPSPQRREQAMLRLGVAVTGLTFLLSVILAAGFDHDHPASMQAITNVKWIPSLDVRVHLGVDGISLPLLVLTALLTFLCAIHALARRPEGPGPRGFVGLLLLLEFGMVGNFVALDLLLFFLAFEVVLIPMYFLIARWGGQRRGPAALRFILYTLLGSAVMLLGLLLIGLKAGTFDMVELARHGGSGLSRTVQITAVLAIGLGLAVKAPMWPLHSWLPDAHTAAPTAGSVLLAGVLLKMGTYGLVRIALPITPEGTRALAPYLGAFAAVGILYGALACLALARPAAASHPPADLKRLIAYSSVGHMGFVLLGIATLTPTGVNGALFANIAHGLITGLLFFLVGAIKERFGSTDLNRIARGTGAALYGRTPRLGGLLAFASVASLGLPGLAGFWGEMLALFGAFRPADELSRPTYLVLMALGGLGTLLTAAYLLMVVRRVCMGQPAAPQRAAGTGEDPHPPRAMALSTAARTPRTGAQADDQARTGPAEARDTAAASGRPVDPPGSPGRTDHHPGGRATPATTRIPDIQRHEFTAWAPLAALTVLLGLWPALLLSLSDPAVQTLLGGGR